MSYQRKRGKKTLSPFDGRLGAAMAGTGNGAPSGAHYNLNIIGVPKNKTATMDGKRQIVLQDDLPGAAAGRQRRSFGKAAGEQHEAPLLLGFKGHVPGGFWQGKLERAFPAARQVNAVFGGPISGVR